MDKRKVYVSLLILIFVFSISSTFAWVSISQTALNEFVYEANPGGRLHDDFNGTNKDVYVENFMSEAEGSVPIYARIRLDEYMEVGEDAGENRDEENRKAASLIKGADINNTSTWKPHIPNDNSDVFHTYWTWHTGGSTTYMPTFNKNKDSLQADINGTYEGAKKDDDIHYDDYVDYTDPKHASKTTKAVYDADNNTADEREFAVEGVNATYEEETHTVKQTQDAVVITMEEWIANDSPIGNYWVYDSDGWAYWASPIQPGETTGLLLNRIQLNHTMNSNYYYAIHVVAQFVTKDDWGSENGGGFFMNGEEPSDDALALLEKIME